MVFNARANVTAGDVDYEVNGHGYALQRRADPRIATRVHAALGNAATILNVGAGAGSYEPEDRYVLAVEPSRTMRAQRPSACVPAISAIAEELPLDDRSVDASMAIMTIHQWKDVAKGLSELLRVTHKSIVVLTFDGDALQRYWLNAYLPELFSAERHRYPPIDTLRDALTIDGRRVDVRTIPIPLDCTDGIIEAYYGRPELLLDDAVRRGQSSWNFLAPGAEERFVHNLRGDLDSGAWDLRHGPLREQLTYEGSLRLIVSLPNDTPR